jgi:hypothetical protein
MAVNLMLHTALVWLESSRLAEQVRDWIPDLAHAGLRRATLFHAMDAAPGRLNAELAILQPELDRLAVTLSSHAVQTDVALKRGDAVPWLVALAASRNADLIVMEAPADARAASRLSEVLEQIHCAVLVMPADGAARVERADVPATGRPATP